MTQVARRQIAAAAPARKPLLVADLFCGAGGSATGATRAAEDLGYRLRLVCVNHWPTAIETHRLNHPEARYFCQDLATVRPRAAVPEGRLDLLMASPTCTFHSRARGGKPTSDQQRMDPWHIIAWLTELRVRRLIVENVREFEWWGPVDQKGKPLRSRRGEYFQQWVQTIRGLGFAVDWRILNAADYGDATTRERLFLIARSDGKALSWPVATHAKRPARRLFGPELKRWRPARDVIDWSIKGRSIFDRKKPLSPKTLARIYAGAVKFKWPEPFLVILRQHMDVQSVDGPLPTITAGGTHIGLAQPFIFANRNNNIGKSLDGPIPTATAATGGGIGIVEPFVATLANSGRDNCRVRSTDEPLQTIHAGGGTMGIVEPFVATVAHGDSPGEKDPSSRRVRSLDDPLQSITASGGQFGIVEPFVLSRHSGGAPRSVEEPTPCQVAKHSHVLIAPYYGEGSGKTCNTVDEPLPTVTTKARFGIVMPVTHPESGDRVRSVEDPLPTITCAPRGELAFIAAAFGERPTQAPRVHSIDAPAPTICATGRINLVEARDFDILFRMLEPHELAAAMGFSADEVAYEFAGTKTEITRQIGNACPVRTVAALVGTLLA